MSSPSTAVRTLRTTYLRDGVVVVPAWLALDAVFELRELVDLLAPAAAPDGPYGILRHNPWPRAETERLLRRSRLPDLAGALLAEREILLFQDHVVWKPPGTSSPVQWHQDYSYWPLAAPAGVTAWVALDAADDENGCLRFVRGTHLLGERRPADFVVGAAQPVNTELPEMDVAERRADVVSVPVAAGDVILHHPLAWHMSPPNRSHRQRRAWSLTWVPCGARWAPEHAPHPYQHTLGPQAGDVVCGDAFATFTELSVELPV